MSTASAPLLYAGGLSFDAGGLVNATGVGLVFTLAPCIGEVHRRIAHRPREVRGRPDWQATWVEEAKEGWGDSPQWAQYAERAVGMTPADWRADAIMTDALNADLAAAQRTSISPGRDDANTVAEPHRAAVSRYYDCTPPRRHALGGCSSAIPALRSTTTQSNRGSPPGAAM
jgi:hypothetical protein